MHVRKRHEAVFLNRKFHDTLGKGSSSGLGGAHTSITRVLHSILNFFTKIIDFIVLVAGDLRKGGGVIINF